MTFTEKISIIVLLINTINIFTMQNSISKFQELHSKQTISKENQNRIKGGGHDDDFDGIDFA